MRSPRQAFGTEEHPITAARIATKRQYHLTCTCGWQAIAVTVNHGQLLANEHAGEPS